MPVSATEMLGIFKEYYTPDEMEQLLFRNSPTLKKIEKRRVSGKTYNYPVLSGMGGAVSGSGTVAVAQSATTARTQQSAATYGKLFSAFQLTELEILASQEDKGAFEPAGVVKMFASSEAARKMMAACLFGSGFGELGKVVGAVAPAATSMVVDDATLVKMDVGTVFSVTDNSTGLPSDPLQGAPDTFTVAKIDSDGTGVNTVTFTPGATAGTGFPNGSWIEINGGRSGATPYMPIGLASIIPYWFNRTGGSWTSYIGTSFFGVDRSTASTRLAGGFVLRNTGAGEKRYQAITRAIKLARRQGAEPDLVVMNDNDYTALVTEIDANKNYWQSLNTDGAGKQNEVTVGMEVMGYQQATSWVKTVIDDPYCPCFIAYVLEMRTIRFVSLSNAEKVTQDGVADNAPGAPPITKDGNVPTDRYALMIEDMLTLNPLSVGVDGAGLQALLSVFGVFVAQNPAHCVVVNLVS